MLSKTLYTINCHAIYCPLSIVALSINSIPKNNYMNKQADSLFIFRVHSCLNLLIMNKNEKVVVDATFIMSHRLI